MDLNWLEDFVSVARTRSFSRSAEERYVTQSAFSRRIRALESWLGADLIDRQTHPAALTAAGQTFLETAEQTVRALHGAREHIGRNAAPAAEMVSIAALHTLALQFFPQWLRRIEGRVGPLRSRLLPDGLYACQKALIDGGYDFMLMMHHPIVPILLEPEDYPHVVVGADGFVAVRAPSCGETESAGMLLTYPDTTFLGRLTRFAHERSGLPLGTIAHTNESAIALKFMTLEGRGYAWLPRSLVAEDLESGVLVAIASEIPMEIRLYRNARRRRAVVDAVWDAACADLAALRSRGR